MTALARAGARFATQPLRGPCAAVALVGNVGAAADPAGEGGRAAAVARARAAKVRPRLAALGGAAFFDVDRDTTVLGAVCPKAKAAEAVSLLLDTVSKPIDDATMEAAKHEQVRELTTTAPDVRELVYGCAYLDTPHGRPVLGTAAEVAALEGATMTTENWAGAGVGCADDVFAALPPFEEKDVQEAVFTGSDMRIVNDGEPLARVCLAYAFPKIGEKGEDAATLLPFILGTQTPTPQTRREPLHALGKLQRDLAEQGIATACDAAYAPTKSHALFSIHWTCPDVRCEDAAYYVTANLARLAHRVSDAEIEAARRAPRRRRRGRRRGGRRPRAPLRARPRLRPRARRARPGARAPRLQLGPHGVLRLRRLPPPPARPPLPRARGGRRRGGVYYEFTSSMAPRGACGVSVVLVLRKTR